MTSTDTGPSARRRRSPEVAATLSFVFPGAGQLYLGRPIAAAVFAFPALITVAWAALQLGQGLFYFAASMLDQGYALTVMIVAAAFTAWRAASIVHPFLVVRPRRIGPRAAAVLAALLIATVGMGDVVFSNAYNAYGLPQQIASNNFVDSTDAPTPSPSASIEGPGYVPQGTNWWEDYWPSDTPEASPTPGKSCGPSWMKPEAAAPAHITAALAAAPAPLVLHAVPNLDAATESATAEPTPTPTAEPTPTPTAEPTPTPTVEPTPTPTAELTPTPTARAPLRPPIRGGSRSCSWAWTSSPAAPMPSRTR